MNKHTEYTLVSLSMDIVMSVCYNGDSQGGAGFKTHRQRQTYP